MVQPLFPPHRTHHQRTSLRQLFFVIAAFVCLLVGVPNTASAHAEYQRSDPPANAVVATAPENISIWFTERLETAGSTAQLFDQDGDLVSGTSLSDPSDPDQLILNLPSDLKNGTYSVVWQTLSKDDGHPKQGYFAFTIGSEANVQAVVPPANISPTSAPQWLRTGARWIALIGLAALVAIWPIWLLVILPAARAAKLEQFIDRRFLRRYIMAALIFAILANLFALAVQAADLPSGNYLDNSWSVLTDTRYGQLWIARIILIVIYTAILTVVDWQQPQQRLVSTGAAGIFAALLPLPFSAISHASAESVGRTAAIATDYFHLLGASLWVGGIIFLVWAVTPLTKNLDSTQRVDLLKQILPRFSAVALAAWGVMVLTGLYAAWLHIGNLHGLTSTTYGKALLAKLLILIPLLALGAFNLLVVSKKLRRGATTQQSQSTAWVRHFRFAIIAEFVLMMVLLAIIGQLTSVSPARSVMEEKASGVYLDLAANDRAGTLWINPAATGPNHFRLELSGDVLPDGTEGLLRISLPSQNLSEQQLDLTRGVGNAFEGHSSLLSIAGDWSITVLVRKIGEFQWQASTDVTIGKEPPIAKTAGPAWHFSASGIVGILLIVASFIGVVAAWRVGKTRLRKESAGLAVGALVLGALLLLQARVAEPTVAQIPITDPVVLARAAETYQANCAACHGVSGQGNGPQAASFNPPPADFTSTAHQNHRPADMILWVTNGIDNSGMPPFGDVLTEQEIEEVVSYVQYLGIAPTLTPTATDASFQLDGLTDAYFTGVSNNPTINKSDNTSQSVSK